jgi:hypothetical protein
LDGQEVDRADRRFLLGALFGPHGISSELGLDHGWQISFRIFDEAHGGFKHLVATAGDA